MHSPSLLMLVLVLSSLSLGAAEPVTLSQAFRWALARSESAGVAVEEWALAEEQYDALRSRVLPRVGFFGNDRFQDVTGVDGGSNSTFTQRRRPEYGFYLRQPIFSGFREFAALSAQKDVRAARAEDLARARQLVYADVADLFFTAAEWEERRRGLEAVRAVTLDRLTELKERVRIGRSRESELISTQAQEASQSADIEEAVGFRDGALSILSSLTGHPIAAVAPRPPRDELPPLEELLKKTVDRPDLRARTLERAALNGSLRAARRGLWPTLQAEGRYYTLRTGFNKPIDWDVVLTLDAPLYQGGGYRADVRRARAELRRQDQRLAWARRSAEDEVRRLWIDFRTDVARLAHLRRAAELSEADVRVQRADYRLGLVGHLEVLTAVNAWEAARLAYEHARWALQRDRARLDVAVGDVPSEVP